MCTLTFTGGMGKRCITSRVSTCSFTPGYEEIRLGSYPITDKNNSHIHPALFSPLTVTWLRDNTEEVIVNKAACLSLALFVCMFLVFLSHFCDSFLTSPSQEIKTCKSCFVFLSASFIWLDLGEDFTTSSQICLSCGEEKMARVRGGNTFNISSNGIKWLSVFPFDCPAGPWESATASHATRWHRFSSPSHYLGRYARGEDESSVFLQLLFFSLPFLLSSSLSLVSSPLLFFPSL